MCKTNTNHSRAHAKCVDHSAHEVNADCNAQKHTRSMRAPMHRSTQDQCGLQCTEVHKTATCGQGSGVGITFMRRIVLKSGVDM